MEFKTDAQKSCYGRIGSYMTELFGGDVRVYTGFPAYGIRAGSTRVQESVEPWHEDDAVVRVESWVVTGTRLTPDLMRFLLNKNCELLLGSFETDSDDDVFLNCDLVGSTCGKLELAHVIEAVAATADEYDDLITAKWGGERMLDRTRIEE